MSLIVEGSCSSLNSRVLHPLLLIRQQKCSAARQHLWPSPPLKTKVKLERSDLLHEKKGGSIGTELHTNIRVAGCMSRRQLWKDGRIEGRKIRRLILI